MFPEEMWPRLGFYVYRLIDPQNGETFYVGKGTGNRVFSHANAQRDAFAEDDTEELKFRRIDNIRRAGLDVEHLIHRHGMSEAVAYQVEAALIDAYPGLTNRVGGHDGEYGVAHWRQLRVLYAAEEAVFAEPAVLISVGRSYAVDGELSLYDATRGFWTISPPRANGRIVLAHVRGLIVGGFSVDEWLPATPENFPERLQQAIPGKWGFRGAPLPRARLRPYQNRRIPPILRRRGAAFPIRYVGD